MEQGRTMADENGNPSAFPNHIGPWTLAARVGAGGMGVVYRASRADLGDRIAALKVIRPGMLDDPAINARFAREVEVLRRVRDIHISEFLDADLNSDPAWLATAFIDGPNLRDYVAGNGPVAEDDWWELAHGLAQALAVLEVHGITHRDLKPANVILAKHGPVLIDFGIAVPEDADSLTGTGLVTGSPAWLSPEQANLQPVTVASDIFSLGSLLTFAGTARPPFGSGAQVAVLMAITTRDPDTAGLSPAQQGLLRAMMMKDPAARPLPRELLQWTRNAGAETPSGYSATAVDASATVVLRPDGNPLDATAVDLPATTPQPSSPHQPPHAPPTAAPVPLAAAEPKRASPWGRVLVIVALLAVAALAGAWWLNRPEGGREPRESASESPSVGPTPAAPQAGDVASSGDWVLSPWSIENNADGTMSVNGTVKNNGSAPASGFATAFIYADGQAIGTASGQLPKFPPGGSAQVTLVGTDPWAAGSKTISLQVQ